MATSSLLQIDNWVNLLYTRCICTTAFLLSLVLSILLLSYRVFLIPSSNSLVQSANSALLLVGGVTLVLFFATGVYSEKIAYAYKWVAYYLPQSIT